MTMKFDRQATEALEALGFAVQSDNARVVGEMVVEIVRLADTTQAEFMVRIQLPNLATLRCFMRRPALLEAQDKLGGYHD